MKNLRLLIIATLCMHGMVHAAGKQATTAVTTVEQADKRFAELIGNAQQNQDAIRALITTVRAIPGVRAGVWANNKTNELEEKLKAPAVAKGKPTTVAAPKQPATKPVTPTQQLPVAQKPAAPVALPAQQPAQPQVEQKRAGAIVTTVQPSKAAPAKISTPPQQAAPQAQPQRVQTEVKRAVALQTAQQAAAPVQQLTIRERIAALQQENKQAAQVKPYSAQPFDQGSGLKAYPQKGAAFTPEVYSRDTKGTQPSASATKPALDKKPKKTERYSGLTINSEGEFEVPATSHARYDKQHDYLTGDLLIASETNDRPNQVFVDLIARKRQFDETPGLYTRSIGRREPWEKRWSAPLNEENLAAYNRSLQTLPEQMRNNLIMYFIDRGEDEIFTKGMSYFPSKFQRMPGGYPGFARLVSEWDDKVFNYLKIRAAIQDDLEPLTVALLYGEFTTAQRLLRDVGHTRTNIIPQLIVFSRADWLTISEQEIINGIKLLCNHDPSLIHSGGNYNNTPLHLALVYAYHHPNIIQALLDCGADPDNQKESPDKQKYNAFEIAQIHAKVSGDDRTLKVLEKWQEERAKVISQPAGITHALPKGVTNIITGYLGGAQAAPQQEPAPTQSESKRAAAQPKLNAKEQDAANQALLRADSMEAIEDALAHGAQINASSPAPKQITRLMRAAEQGDDRTVRRLIELGASINQTDYVGETALIKAVKANRAQVVRMLVNAGADRQIRARAELGESEGKTALQYARNNDAILEILNFGPQVEDVD